MQIRRLRMLALAGDSGSIGAAARTLRIAQPALSRQLRALETDVGVDLLEREARGVRLSAAGRTLLSGTQHLGELLTRAVQRVRLTREGRLGSLRIGVSRIALDDPRVGRTVVALRAEHPGIEQTVVELGGPLHTQSLLRDEIDLAIGTEETPHHRRLDRRTLRIERIRTALVPASHPAALSSEITPEQIAGLPLLMPGRSAGWIFPEVRRALADLGFGTPEEYDSIETVYGLVAAGLGWIPVAAAYESAAPLGTVGRPLRGLALELPILLRWRRGEESPLLNRMVRTFLREYKRQESPTMTGAPPAEKPGDVRVEATAERSAVDAELADRIELRHLRAMVAIAFAGSVTDASRRLELTQSAVSRQLAALERIVGAPLFSRRSGGLHVTAAGERMRVEATAVLADYRAACAAARLAAQGIARRCTLGFVPSPLAAARVRSLLGRRATELPEVSIEIREMGSPSLRAALLAREIDAALVVRSERFDDGDELIARILDHDPVDGALIAASHPLAQRARLTRADLSGLPLLFYPRGKDPVVHDEMVALLRADGVEPRIGPAYEGLRTLWRLVADGAGWTPGLRSMRDAPPPGLVAVPIEDFVVSASLSLLSRRDESDPHILAVIEAICVNN